MKYVLLGGSGTLGSCLMSHLYADHDVVCFSRGEHAQKRLQQEYPDARFVIGDVRDRGAVLNAVKDADVVFLLAAIKHVDVAQENPLETIKTNVLGAINVAAACEAACVKYVIFSNTDKAVLPITTYGYSKALAQDYLLSRNIWQNTRYSAYVWGNVVASQGSAIPIFVRAILADEPVPVTDLRMSRFWLNVDTAANFMLSTYRAAPLTYAQIPPVKGATVARVILSCGRILGKRPKMQAVGMRGVEKLYEVLESSHERCLRSDTCEQYTDDELDTMLEPKVKEIANAHR